MPGPKRIVEKPKNIKVSLTKLLKSLRPWYLAILIATILTIISSVFSIFGPKILGNITTEAVNSLKDTGSINWTPISKSALILIILYLASSGIGYLREIIFGIITAKYTKKLRKEILDKIHHLPIFYFDHHQFGDTLSRMSNDVDILANSLSNELAEIISSITTIIGILIMMLSISLPLSIIAVITVPLSFLAVSKVATKAQKFFASRQTTLGNLNNNIEEDYSGLNIIIANSHEKQSIEDFKKVNNKLYRETWKSQFLSSLAFPLTNIFTNLSYIAICITGGYLTISGKISIGDIQAFIQYVSQFNRPITNLSDITATIQLTLAASERIFNFKEEENEKINSENLKIQRLKGAVEFRNVNFGYDKNKPIIKNFSAKIEPGQRVAIVGPTGAGKTTIINLLMRFYDPDSGDILIDGISTKNMSRQEVRKLFGMVLQDTWLFSGTIEENLRYGNRNASLSEIVKVAKITNMHHYIESLPHGYNTEISEDSDNISAGEKQLLTVTRAMISNPPMMILDEATSNVDTRTEQSIQDAFEKITKGKTSFVIAHRLSTIRNSDLILVIKNGNIIEQGNHQTLLAKKSFYAKLYNSQFKETM